MMEQLSGALHYWTAGGPLLIPIALVCFGIWAYLLSLHRRLREALSAPRSLEDEIEHRIGRGESLQEVSQWLSGYEGLLPRTAAYALKQAAEGGNVRDALDECRRRTLPFFDRQMLILTALVAAAPLLGLLGTVFGMIDTFRAVSQYGVDTATLVAGGISQALITTQFGLVTALPGVFGLMRLRRMCRQLELRFMTYESHLSLVFERHRANLQLDRT
jgi:biopolymer transport protein ExbB